VQVGLRTETHVASFAHLRKRVSLTIQKGESILLYSCTFFMRRRTKPPKTCFEGEIQLPSGRSSLPSSKNLRKFPIIGMISVARVLGPTAPPTDPPLVRSDVPLFRICVFVVKEGGTLSADVTTFREH
jgi:hypothetical protein